MSRWENGEIVAEFNGLTDEYTDNFIRAYGVKNGWMIVYVDYAKGDEAYAEVQLYSDNSNRLQLLVVDSGYEDWFAYGTDGIFPAEGNNPTDLTDYVPVRALPWRFTATGKHRMTVMMLPREDAIKIAVRSDLEEATGNVKVRFCTDEMNWGGVGQGDE